jgi:hypothetical protein
MEHTSRYFSQKGQKITNKQHSRPMEGDSKLNEIGNITEVENIRLRDYRYKSHAPRLERTTERVLFEPGRPH